MTRMGKTARAIMVLLLSAPCRAADPPRISAGEAVAAARQLVGKGWQLAKLSTRGQVGGSTYFKLNWEWSDLLMAPDGKAGQWVLEFVSDRTEPVSEGGRTGTLYKMRRVLVAPAADEKASESVIKSRNGPF